MTTLIAVNSKNNLKLFNQGLDFCPSLFVFTYYIMCVLFYTYKLMPDG